MYELPPLTNPVSITVIATAAVLTAAAIFQVIKFNIELYQFRNNIKPGDYARIFIDGQYYRAKLVTVDQPFYKFMILDCKKYQVVIKSKIYQL